MQRTHVNGQDTSQSSPDLRAGHLDHIHPYRSPPTSPHHQMLSYPDHPLHQVTRRQILKGNGQGGWPPHKFQKPLRVLSSFSPASCAAPPAYHSPFDADDPSAFLHHPENLRLTTGAPAWYRRCTSLSPAPWNLRHRILARTSELRLYQIRSVSWPWQAAR